MGKIKTIVVTIVLVFGMSAAPAVGTAADLPVAGLGRVIVPATVSIYTGQALWAQNDTGENEKAESSEPDAGTKESESTEDDKGKTTKSKPLKPFVPSEKIPGEQAVDVPVDI